MERLQKELFEILERRRLFRAGSQFNEELDTKTTDRMSVCRGSQAGWEL